MIKEEKKEDSFRKGRKAITMDDLSKGVQEMGYLLSNAAYNRGMELVKMQKSGISLPFQNLYLIHYGDAQLGGQPPNTFLRQVLAAALYPKLLEADIVSADVAKRVKYYFENIPNGVIASYPESKGFKVVRKSIANYIYKRDGFPADDENIFLFDGISEGMAFVFNYIIGKEDNAVLLPFPQYAEYGFFKRLLNKEIYHYYMDEDKNWTIDMTETERTFQEATAAGAKIKAMVVINPNNPTGSVLSKEEICEFIHFAYKNNLMIIADEVFQLNVHSPKGFTSFKKAVSEMNAPYNQVELISFMTISKGYLAECGLRGAYMELINFDENVLEQIIKVRDISAVNVIGSLALEVMCNPPTYEDCSKKTVELYQKEKQDILSAISNQAKIAVDILRTCKNITINNIEGGTSAYPRIHLTDTAILAAKAKRMQPCDFFCYELVDRAGILAIPGCEFSQKEGTYHFKISLLLWPMKKFEDVMIKIKNFINNFFMEYP